MQRRPSHNMNNDIGSWFEKRLRHQFEFPQGLDKESIQVIVDTWRHEVHLVANPG